MDGLKAIQTFSYEDKIRMKRGNLFETGVNGAAHFGFFLSVGRVVAEFGVADKAILQTERIDRFGQARSKGHDATNGLRNADGAAGFVDDFAVDRGGGRENRGTLCARGRCAEQQSSRGTNDPSQTLAG